MGGSGISCPHPPYVLIDDATAPGARSHLFTEPLDVLVCTDRGDVASTLERVEEARARGHHVAGFLAYEAGYALEPRFRDIPPAGEGGPLIWMGVFGPPETLISADVPKRLRDWTGGGYALGPPQASVTRDAYLRAVGRIQDYIVDGDVYQINYTFKYGFDFSGGPLALYADLRPRQRAAFGACVATGDTHILSLSPELFVEVRDGQAMTRPMKGTAPRALTAAGDAEQRASLRDDEKSRAENLMIVDLLRNDLGRVAEIGSVRVSDLFSIETYPTLHQMTSGVTARLGEDVGFADVIRALFPCGSVTGAPKVRAMEIIRETEGQPRGVYTGAVGMASPDGSARFNVAIRTVVVGRDGRGEMGIGSGIVFDSDPEAEYEECRLKARFLTEPRPSFQLIETLRWEAGEGFFLLERHMDRLRESAAYFGMVCDVDDVQRRLEAAVSGLETGIFRVRLLLDEAGGIEIGSEPLAGFPTDATLTYAVSDRPVDRLSPFTYHKTTERAFYDGERQRLQAETGCDEVVFLNDRGELTEGSFTNLFIERDGRLLTPPVDSGLLAGTLRAEFLETGRATEVVLTRADIEGADNVFLGNSVRGLLKTRPMGGGE